MSKKKNKYKLKNFKLDTSATTSTKYEIEKKIQEEIRKKQIEDLINRASFDNIEKSLYHQGTTTINNSLSDTLQNYYMSGTSFSEFGISDENKKLLVNISDKYTNNITLNRFWIDRLYDTLQIVKTVIEKPIIESCKGKINISSDVFNEKECKTIVNAIYNEKSYKFGEESDSLFEAFTQCLINSRKHGASVLLVSGGNAIDKELVLDKSLKGKTLKFSSHSIWTLFSRINESNNKPIDDSILNIKYSKILSSKNNIINLHDVFATHQLTVHKSRVFIFRGNCFSPPNTSISIGKAIIPWKSHSILEHFLTPIVQFLSVIQFSYALIREKKTTIFKPSVDLSDLSHSAYIDLNRAVREIESSKNVTQAIIEPYGLQYTNTVINTSDVNKDINVVARELTNANLILEEIIPTNEMNLENISKLKSERAKLLQQNTNAFLKNLIDILSFSLFGKKDENLEILYPEIYSETPTEKTKRKETETRVLMMALENDILTTSQVHTELKSASIFHGNPDDKTDKIKKDKEKDLEKQHEMTLKTVNANSKATDNNIKSENTENTENKKIEKKVTKQDINHDTSDNKNKENKNKLKSYDKKH